MIRSLIVTLRDCNIIELRIGGWHKEFCNTLIYSCCTGLKGILQSYAGPIVPPLGPNLDIHRCVFAYPVALSSQLVDRLVRNPFVRRRRLGSGVHIAHTPHNFYSDVC